MRVGFISANLVARAAGYREDWAALEHWGDHDRYTRERFDPDDCREWFGRVADLGFEGVSLWTAHLWYHDATPERVEAVRDLAAEFDLPIYAYAGGFGQPPAGADRESAYGDWERTFEVADGIGAGWLAGGYGDPEHRGWIRDLVDEYDVGFAFENHPEGSVGAIEARIEGYEDCMGVALDTGWLGTQGVDAPAAIRALDDRLTEIHLKDVEAAGGHETCALGDGVVDVRGCLDALDDVGYDGWLSLEHEPFDRDPFPELETSLGRVRGWL